MDQLLARTRVVAAIWLVAILVCANTVWGDEPDVPPTPDSIDGAEAVPEEPLEAAVVSDGGSGAAARFECGGDCGGCSTCDSCCFCGPPGHLWLRDEYVGWWATGGRVPALLNTSSDGSLPATETLYGNAKYNNQFRSGNWFRAGLWFGCSRRNGLTGDYFFVGRQSSPYSASSDGDPVLTRPYVDANTGDAAEELVAFPNTVMGSITIDNYNSFVGAGGAWRHNICCWSGCVDSCRPCGGEFCSRVDFAAGFRYYRFNDNLGVAEQLTSIDTQSGIPVGTQFAVADSFRTMNNFYGAELGLIVERYRGRWMFEGAGKVGLGTTQQIVAIDGSTVVSNPGQPTTVHEGGILALPTNIGRHSQNSFSVVPQLSARIGYRVTPRLTMLVGYTAIYWDQVARAGDQIDTTVNPNLIPPPIGGGPDRPSLTLHLSDVFLQGITLGGEYCF